MNNSARERAPYLYRLAKFLDRKGIRGSWRMLNLLQRFGMLDRPVLYPLSGSIGIGVPIGRNRWDAVDVAQYEIEFIERLSSNVAQLPAPVTLIDGGADFGLFSLKLLSRCPSIQRIVAFEPNGQAYSALKSNFDRLCIAAEAIPKALADFEGRGTLELPPANIEKLSDWPLDDAARFLTSSPNGPIHVTTIDSLVILPSQSIVIKLDIEGGELAALRGASRTVQSASNIIVAIEAHPLVRKRTCIDPVECLRVLSSWRTFTFIVAETGAPLNIDCSVFDQLPPQIYNIIGVSSSAPNVGASE